jgi:hypothetical protein
VSFRTQLSGGSGTTETKRTQSSPAFCLGLLGLLTAWTVTAGRLSAQQPSPNPATSNLVAKSGPKIFLIGNSLTWDCVPALLRGDVSWHVDCGKSLQKIYETPAKPCVPSSSLWPSALQNKKFDYLCVQPHFGTTLRQDIEVIDHWVTQQPQAVLVIHTGWARHADVEKEFHAGSRALTLDTQMQHSPEYFQAISRELKRRHPQLVIRSTKVTDALDKVWHDIEAQRAPIKALSELYRDDLHLTVQGGRYLAHNLLRRALDQPASSQGFQLESDLQNYLDQTMQSLDD